MANVIKHKRGSGSDPGASDLILGELAIRTDTGKLFTKMDSGAIAEIAGGGSDIAINTLSSSSGTGGGSATFNGSAYRFTLSQPPNVSAAQLLVSINGVIQKPVAGTGQPSEGFSVDGTDIILGDAPATGSDFFILTFKSLGVSEPADNSVTSAKIVDGAIVNADINASAAIAGSKISPTFTSDLIISNALPKIFLTDTGHNPDYSLKNQNGAFVIHDTTNGVDRLKVNTDGHIDIAGNLDVGAGIDVTGTITGTGDLTIDTNTLHVDSTNNRVGIGTTSPATLLVLNHATNPAIRFQDSGTKVASINSEGTDTNIASFEGKDMVFATSDSSAFLERMRIDATTGTLKFNKSVYGDQGSEDFYRIKFNDVGGTGNDVGIGQPDSSSIGFNTVSNGSIRFYQGTDDEVMRIHNNKYVGIGTTSPEVMLDIRANDPGIQLVDTSGTLTYGNIDFIGDTLVLTSRGGSSSDGIIDFRRYDGTTVDTSMRLDSSGRLIVGATSGAGKFIVQDSSLPKIQANFNGTAHLESGVGGSGGGFAITTGHFLTFNHQPYANRGTDTNLTERMRILSDGGLTFNGDTAAANALDDYEEGTWTPAGINFTVQSIYSAHYTKIGNVVFIQMYVQAATGSGTSAVSVSGLPYTVKGSNYYSYAACRIGGSASQGYDKVFQFNSGTTNMTAYVADGNINEGMISGTHLIMSGFYHVA